MPGRVKNIQVAIAVIERNGRYLISRRRPGDHLGGFWEFPGGKRLVGESWEACLRRELREELGIAATVVERLQPICFRYPDRQVRLEVFRCAIQGGHPQPLDCQEIRWVPAGQLRRYRFPPADRKLIQQLSRPTPLSHHPATPPPAYSPKANAWPSTPNASGGAIRRMRMSVNPQKISSLGRRQVV